MNSLPKIKICVVTGSRAEYGLFFPLLNLFNTDKQYELKILVTGMHLSPEFGLTYKEIEKDGFKNLEKIEVLLSSDTSVGVSKSVGLGIISFSDFFYRYNPKWVFVLGDRFETFAAVTAAYFAKIPIVHLHGGESTQGATDEAMRHSITKMSSLHFTSTESYRKRVIQLGEQPNKVFNVGAIGLDNIYNLNLLSKSKLSNLLQFDFNKPYFLVTFHPVTLENQTSEIQFKNLINAFENYKDYNIIFTLPNADVDGRIIIKLIQEFVLKNSHRAKWYTSLGQLKYLSALKNCTVVIGNSSSGIIEAPSFNIPTINIGDRQKGREKGITVIDSEPNQKSIEAAIKKSLSRKFVETCKKSSNPYGTGNTSKKVKKIFEANLSLNLLKKEFFDL
jgi:GDP/UDP-N,N'-diacetylbacillosamine 2-epimerase (hydrolysing)